MTHDTVRLSLLLPCLVAMTMVLTIIIPSAEAHNTYISIIRGETCKMIQCIKVSDYVHLDNSTQAVSGKLILENGDYTRAKSPLKNSIKYYSMFDNKKIIFVEPDQHTLSKSRVITIQHSLPVYFAPGQKAKSELDFNTDIRRFTEAVYVDSRCHSAIVGIKEGGSIEQTIQYMLNDCKGDYTTQFIQEVKTDKKRDYYCGKQCQHEKWMKEALEKAKSNQLRKAN